MKLEGLITQTNFSTISSDLTRGTNMLSIVKLLSIEVSGSHGVPQMSIVLNSR